MKPKNNSKPYDKLADYYDEMFAAWGKDYQNEAEKLHLSIERFKLSPGNTLLDLGCGTGGHIEYHKNYYKISGLDSSLGMVSVAKKKYPDIDFYHMDMVNFYLDNKFDIIISLFSAIGYVCTWKNLCKVLTSIDSHLVPGGVIVIEPWYTPEEFEFHRNDVLFGEKYGVKACRMRESIIVNRRAKILEHILIASNQRVTHLKSKQEFGLFSIEDFLSAFNKTSIKVEFIKGGFTDRGMYIGTKPK